MNDTDKLITKLSQEAKKRARFSPVKMTSLWLGTISLYFLAVSVFFGARPDLVSLLTQPYFLGEMVVLIALILAASFAAIYLALPDRGNKAWLFPLALVLLCVFGVLVLIQLLQMGTSLSVSLEEKRYDCPQHVILFLIIPALFFIVILMKGASLHPFKEGVMLGVALSATGYFWLRIIEETNDISHIFIWHFLPLFVVSIVLMLVGGILMKLR